MATMEMMVGSIRLLATTYGKTVGQSMGPPIPRETL